MSRNEMSDRLYLYKMLERIDQGFSELIQLLDDDILKKKLNKNEKELWEHLSLVFETLRGSLNLHRASYEKINQLYDQMIAVTSKIPELKDELKQLKEQRMEIALKVPENIQKALEKWLRAVERAQKAQSQYVG